MSTINVCLVQLQDVHDMLENVRQSNLQLVFLQTLFKEEKSEFCLRACFVIFKLNLLPKLKKLKDLKTGQNITKGVSQRASAGATCG